MISLCNILPSIMSKRYSGGVWPREMVFNDKIYPTGYHVALITDRIFGTFEYQRRILND